MPYHDAMWGWDGMWFGPLIMFGFLLLFVVLVVMVIRWLAGGRSESSSNRAIDILKERYAKGEIDKQEFEERRKVLQSS